MARVHSQLATPGRKTSILRRRGVRWAGALVAVLIVAALVVRATVLARPADPMAGIPTIAVARGPLLISVTESGTIRSRQQEVIKCEVEGGSTILFLIAEGTRVKQGDLLVELDGSRLQDQIVAQEILVKNAEASYIGAEESYEVAKSQARSDVAKAQLDARFAEEDVKKYIDGDYVAEHKAKDSKIKLAEERLEQARQKLDWSKKLFEGKYISQTELQADELTFKSAELDVSLAKSDLNLLEAFTYGRRLAELTAAVEQTKMALERVERKAKADIIQAEAARSARKAEFERQQTTLAKQKRMLDKTKIFAPVDGMVVYATTSDSRMNREPLMEGSTVRERQDLINLPTTSSVMAEVKIHESSLDKLMLGQPVRVTVDALPGRTFTGRVARIAPLPDSASMWANPDLKVYNTQIFLDEGDDNLRTGMSCRAEIIVDYYPDAVYVPVHSVMRVGREPTVYVATPTGPQPRPVKLGLDNNSMVRILDGLTAGEKVLLAPPLAAAGSNDVADAPPKAEPLPNGLQPTTRPAAPAPRPAARPENGAAVEANGAGRATDGAGAGRAGGEGAGRNLTPEQREEMRRRMESMSPEEREQMRRTRTPRPEGQGGPGGPGQGGGRQPRGEAQ